MKTNLKNYEERFVDYMEGQLNADEMREVEAFVAQHPELEEDFKLFCSTKLEPDTSVVFTKKESLMQPTTVIRPLYVRIVAAAACVALLIGIGIRFLKPHQEIVKQPMLASLTPIEARGISQAEQVLRKSDVKAVPIAKSVPESPEVEESLGVEETMLFDMIATMEPVKPKTLDWGNSNVYDEVDTRMFVELGKRLAALEPLYESGDSPLVEPIASLQDQFFGNVRQATRTLYKRTAKTVMDIYYTADYRINDAKDQLMASR